MNLERASIGATAVLPFSMVVLLVRHALFAARPGLVVEQVLAVILVIWARLTSACGAFTTKPILPTAACGLHETRHPISRMTPCLFGVIAHKTSRSYGAPHGASTR